jgi:hypothetical protein
MTRRELFAIAAGIPCAWLATARAALAPKPASIRAPADDELTNRAAQYALQAILSNLQMGALVRRNFEPILAQAYDTVNIPIRPLLVSNCWNEDREPRILGNCQVTLDKHMEATFTLPDADKALANPAYLQPFVMPASIALSEAIESDLMGLTPEYAWAASGSNWHWVLNQAEEALFNSKVPMARAKYVVVDADTYSILRQYPSFSERWLNGRNVGKIGELFILRTQFLRPGGPCPAFAQDAGVLVSRRLPRVVCCDSCAIPSAYAETADFGIRVTSSKSTLPRARNFTVDLLYGVGSPRPHFGRQVRFERG